jgi:hypothetical protein
MKLIPQLVSIGALLLPCALAAQTFEGKVSMKITSADSKDGSQSIDMSMKEGFLRMDMNSSKGAQGGMISDFKNQQMTILMPQQKMYMTRPIPQPGSSPQSGSYPRPNGTPNAPQASLQQTGVKETILGYECTKYVATGQEGTSEIWVTDQLGTFTGLFHGGGPGRRPQAPQGWESALTGKSFFPMRVVTSANGKEKFRLEVTSVEKGSLPDSLFTPPSDWRKFDLGSMMGGAMPGGFPGARPADGNN